MAFYSERAAIPRRVVHELKEDGSIGEPIEMETRASVVREMDADVFLTYASAKSIHEWLGERIEELEQKLEEANDDT